jgi:hypothetical protein
LHTWDLSQGRANWPSCLDIFTSVYADVAAVFPYADYNRLESGFIG